MCVCVLERDKICLYVVSVRVGLAGPHAFRLARVHVRLWEPNQPPEGHAERIQRTRYMNG